MLEENKIYCGDCLDIMERMDNNSVDLTVTSPPYDNLRDYNGYTFNVEKIAKKLFDVTKDGGICVWVVGDKVVKGNKSLTSFKQALIFQNLGWNVHDVMIYQKKNTPFMRSNAYTNAFEYTFIFSKGKPKTFNPLKVKTVRSGREKLVHNKLSDGINKKRMGTLNKEKVRTNIWKYAVGLGGTTTDKIAFKHPAIFPEKLAEDHIKSWSNPGELIFDPMCGSGTTCKMAFLNNRKYIGCDISQDYVNIANQRLEQYTHEITLDI